MGLLRNRLLRRFSPLGRVADVALVASMGLRLAKRMGWIADNNSASASEMSLSGSSGGSSLGLPEMAMAGAALLRLLRRKR